MLAMVRCLSTAGAGLAIVALSLAGCATVRMTPTETAITATSIEQRFGIAGAIRMPSGTRLVLATVDGKKAYCSTEQVAFNPGEGRGACFFEATSSGYFDKWYMLGTLASVTMDGIHIPYSIAGNVTPRTIANVPSVAPINPCDPTITNPYLKAECVSPELIAARAKRDAGKKLTVKEAGIIVQGDQADATARMAEQAAQAQAALQQATAALQQQADELARQQRLAACTAAADAVALSIRSFWGGIAAGVATGAACMN